MPRDPEILQAFKELAPCAGIAAGLCKLAAEGRMRVAMDMRVACTTLGLPQARLGDVASALDAGEEAGVFERTSASTWRAIDESRAEELQPLLEGAALYLDKVHHDDDVVEIVISTPPAPSAMIKELEGTLRGTWGLRNTLALLPAIAESARTSLVVMTPFLDEMGAAVVVNLFARTRASNRCLILRTGASGKPPEGFFRAKDRLAALGVDVRSFRLARPDGNGFETFHAKVVLADDEAAYLGSANMLRSSFEHSLELGFYVRGKAAKRLADVVRVIRPIALPLQLDEENAKTRSTL